MPEPTSAIWWIRRDLRLSDNHALNAALGSAQRVIPLFILDPFFERYPTPARQSFLFNGLRALDDDLRALGSRLIVRRGNPAEVLKQVCVEIGTRNVFAEQDFSPYAKRRDSLVSEHASLSLIPGVTIHPPGSVCKNDGSPYSIFTPFRNAWNAFPQPGKSSDAPQSLGEISTLVSEVIPESTNSLHWEAGERPAQRKLEHFIEKELTDYANMRNFPAHDGTSQLSPYIHFGMLSARQVWHAVKQAQLGSKNTDFVKSCQIFIDELVWREFYTTILHFFPYVLNQAFRPKHDRLEWRDDPSALKAWQCGETGYPMVDAGMRQLAQTGWMHNRVRMIVASFLVKDLFIDWKAGQAWFMRMLVDGDAASNNGGWQWTAGTGTDAAPFFRVFNPVLQGKRFDPVGEYVRRYIPELNAVPNGFIHEPWLMPNSLQNQLGIKIGRDYPHPIVEHSAARERAIKAWQALRLT